MMVHRFLVCLALVLLAGPGWSVPAIASAAQDGSVRPVPLVPIPSLLTGAIRKNASGPVGDFYAGRGFRPLWVRDGIVSSEAQALLGILDSARLDGLKPSRYSPDKLRKMMARADTGDVAALAKAEIGLSKAFAKYVGDLRRTDKSGLEYADPALIPKKPDPELVLRVAALAPSFADYIRSMGWMSAHYVRIRGYIGIAQQQGSDDHVLRALRLNLERARFLPSPAVRHIVVDIASARLWYYQGGQEAGSMRVVVGALKTPSPMLAGSLNYAILNPYWNVPDYLIRDNIARKVLTGRTLKSMHMEILSDWTPDARKVDPSTVNWQAVAAGQMELRMRELPGPANSMGKVKFVFPNTHGIYLHDTPNTDLFVKDDRHLSNGCIRLEKAAELGKWMLGQPVVNTRNKAPEQAIAFRVPVPVYLTYLTATTNDQGVGFLPDVYGMDK